MAKKYKLTYKDKSAYTPHTNSWAFVKKVKGGYKVGTSPVICKDYLHESIANTIHKETLFVSASTHTSYISLNKFRIAMFFKDNENDPNFKKQLYSIKKYINTLEKKYDIPQTTIIEVDSGYADSRAFVITASKAYIQSPGLHHNLVAMMRTLNYSSKNITTTNIKSVLKSIKFKDTQILQHMIRYNVLELLLKYHKRIIKNTTLKEIYPKHVNNSNIDAENITSYHNGFGIVAICSHKIASKVYAEAIIQILKKAKVPIYNME